MHVVGRGALIGGAVGAVLALIRPRKGERRGSELVRLGKSVAEGALAGAAVGLVVDHRVREQVVEQLPELVEQARARVAELRAAA